MNGEIQEVFPKMDKLFKCMYTDQPVSVIKDVFVCLLSIRLGGTIRPWVQKVSRWQGHPGST